MVYAQGVEILLHVLHAPLEPLADGELALDLGLLVLLVPMVGREAPVLPLRRELIGRCPSLRVQVEEFGMLACLHAVAIDPDGQVALQHHALRAGIVGSGLQLGVQQILHVADVVVVLLAELGIGFQPVLVGLYEVLALPGSKHTGSLFLVECLQVFVLDSLHRLVVAIRQGVQFQTATLKLGHQRLGLQRSGSLEVYVVGMQGKDAGDVVGIGVVPVSVRRGVADG